MRTACSDRWHVTANRNFRWSHFWILSVLVLLPCTLCDATAKDNGRSASVRALTIEPAEIILSGANRKQQVLVTSVTAHGRLIDLTRECELIIEDQTVARPQGAILIGVSDGATHLVVRARGQEARVAVRVNGFARYPPVHFVNDVVPILSKVGCNSGNCHGKASGKNGFKLSVFGFDPRADYEALVCESRGRRVFPASPEYSLFLRKPTGSVPHGGGRRIEEGSADYELLRQWILQGMPWGRQDAPKAVAIQVSPAERVMGFGADQQILTTAVYSDGNMRDVTDAALYSSNASAIAEVDNRGLIRTGRVPGEASITVNYMGHVQAVRVQMPRPGGPDPYPRLAANNRIDELVWAKLEKMGIVPSGLVDDATFLRRLFLTSIGTLPATDEVRTFLADTRADKRARWIDAVLERDEYADYWALKWADILLVDRKKLGDRGAFTFHRWLRRQFERNRPYDEWVRELITATGSSARNGPVNFYRALRTPEELARSVSQAFLGVRLECAQCHHHPFEKWSQQDFYGLAGFFNGIVRKTLGPDRELVYHAGYRETRFPLTNERVPTRPPGGAVPGDLERIDPRVRLADWLIDETNPWVPRLAANRLWKHYLGRGLVSPEDDLRVTNPATNKPLLQYLADQLVEYDYDLKAVMRLILNSRVFQLSSIPNESNRTDEQNFSHYQVRRLPAEVLLDAICAVTEVPERFAGRPPRTRAIELWDNRMPSYFLDVFGRPARTSPCECGRTSDPTMSQALHLMNAPEVQRKISDPRGRVARLLGAGASAEALLNELCLAVLGRPPAAKEVDMAEQLFLQGVDKQSAEDLLWVLLNSYEFLFVQ